LNYLKLLPGYVGTGGRRKEGTATLAQAEAQEKNKKHLNRGQQNGALLSPAVRRKIKKIGTNWINSMMIAESFYRHKKRKNLMYKSIPRGSHPVFMTLTIPGTQRHTDNEIKEKCLDRFLAALRKKYKGDIHYMWVAELQKRGAIHFHIITDRYMHHTQTEALWAKALTGLNYNSAGTTTNTQSIKAAELPGYLTKYFTKDKTEDAKEVHGLGVTFPRDVEMIKRIKPGTKSETETIVIPKIQGRKWGASYELLQLLEQKVLNYCRFYLENFHEFRRWMAKRVTREGGAKDILYHSEKCLVLRQPLQHLPQMVKELFYSHNFELCEIFNPKSARNVSKLTYVLNAASNWRNMH
jgi:hypothetical protein